MQIRLLPSTFDTGGFAAPAQHLTTVVIDGCVALDAGSLALSGPQYTRLRDIIVTHPHLDHIATLPIFIDDLFGVLERPVRVHTTPEIIATLEANIFNWMIYPRFSELRNENGPVLEYVPLKLGETVSIKHLRVTTVPVNHGVPTFGAIVDDGDKVVVFTSDTAATDELWQLANEQRRLDAVVLECSFPDCLAKLADQAGHLTPASLAGELKKLRHQGFAVFAMHIKPAYHEEVTGQLKAASVQIMEPGRDYVI